MQDWFFSSEASTVVKWNEDHSEVLAIDDLSMRSLQTMFTAPLVAE